jgi:hypothetical protein
MAESVGGGLLSIRRAKLFFDRPRVAKNGRAVSSGAAMVPETSGSAARGQETVSYGMNLRKQRDAPVTSVRESD